MGKQRNNIMISKKIFVVFSVPSIVYRITWIISYRCILCDFSNSVASQFVHQEILSHKLFWYRISDMIAWICNCNPYTLVWLIMHLCPSQRLFSCTLKLQHGWLIMSHTYFVRNYLSILQIHCWFSSFLFVKHRPSCRLQGNWIRIHLIPSNLTKWQSFVTCIVIGWVCVNKKSPTEQRGPRGVKYVGPTSRKDNIQWKLNTVKPLVQVASNPQT